MNLPTHEQWTKAGDRWETTKQVLAVLVAIPVAIFIATMVGASIFAVIVQTFFRSTL